MKNLVIAFVGAATATSWPAAAQEQCRGDTLRNHPFDEYDFSTNSHVEPGNQFAKYFACVENNKDTWLRLSWFLPLLTNRWVAPGDHIEEYRLSADQEARPVLGCVEYGNLGERDVSPFLGDANEERQSQTGPGEVACRNAAGLDNGPSETVVELPTQGLSGGNRIFVPSDLSDPVNSMLEVHFNYGVTPSQSGYETFFSYNAVPFNGSTKANPENVHVRSRFTPRSTVLAASWNQQIPGANLQLAKEGSFAFSVAGSSQWTIQPAFYDFVDNAGNVLTSLQVPLFEPANPQ